MIIPGTNLEKLKHVIMMICGTILLVISHVPAFAQEQPPKPITIKVNTLRNLNFGTFIYSGGSGTVTVTPLGDRTATGSIILPNTGWIGTPALFEVEAIPGTLITIQNVPTARLYGSLGSITLNIGASYPQSPFIATGAITTTVTIGGTLTVGPELSADPAGNYSGSFDVTFIQQ
jgi:hypothetical protein